jgi:cyclic pyranopterin phosphate synthase
MVDEFGKGNEVIEKHPLVDSFGRHITRLRISLTEQCNFRCVYCVPQEGVSAPCPSRFLRRDQVVRLVHLASQFGITHIRLTGGEPLLRSDIVEIIRDLKAIRSLHDVSMTTNASRLAQFVDPLKEAGLDRLNISLDSLDPDRFQRITKSNLFEEVFHATHLALSRGFPVKLNVVAMQGLTPSEIIRFVRLAHGYPLEVRFLEFMPLCGSSWNESLFLPVDEIRQIVKTHFELSEELPRQDHPAQVFRLKQGMGNVGFIAPLTEPFCNQCSRIRLTADGSLRPCLFSKDEYPVGALLKDNASDEAILEMIRLAVKNKPAGSAFQQTPYNLDETLPVAAASNPLIRRIGG